MKTAARRRPPPRPLAPMSLLLPKSPACRTALSAAPAQSACGAARNCIGVDDSWKETQEDSRERQLRWYCAVHAEQPHSSASMGYLHICTSGWQTYRTRGSLHMTHGRQQTAPPATPGWQYRPCLSQANFPVVRLVCGARSADVDLPLAIIAGASWNSLDDCYGQRLDIR